MPKNKPTYNEAVDFNFKDILKAVSLDDIVFVNEFEGEQRRDFLQFCYTTFNNPFFKQILKNHVYMQVMFTAEEGLSYEEYMGGKMMVQGMKTIEDFFRKYAFQYDKEFNQSDEEFDPRKSFNKAKIN